MKLCAIYFVKREEKSLLEMVSTVWRCSARAINGVYLALFVP
jgi:hypothetical protein